ncbi:MAG: cupin domain-containing protein [Bacteroidota bacterium]|nr:homogentisate 1,2-dioxygenase [Rhodothermia bacterium]MDW8284556.1 cupin domain-containing protein [Bacteroidota bacterium]
MPYYVRLGQLPHKRHTQFRKPDGSLYAEEVFGTEGFSGVSAILYHLYPPTRIARILEPIPWQPEVVPTDLRPRHLRTWPAPEGGDFLFARIPLLTNPDVTISIARPTEAHTGFFYKNAEGDELIFVHQGQGVLETIFGDVPFGPGDYLIIPRGTIHRYRFEDFPVRLFIADMRGAIQIPKKYRNAYGQMEEHAPYCERDMRPPVELRTYDETGDFEVRVKKQGFLYRFIYPHHPFDVVGWDGYNYPWAISIHDFEPITGRIHQPPPVHQMFAGPNLVVCSFVPRLFDYHPLAIPAPYNHSNIDSDEVLYYVDGNFMSRRGIEVGSLTLHPGGIPHGPHPGTVEASIGAKETRELAVMLDTFRPLSLTRQALALEDPQYAYSWLEKPVTA